MGILGVENGDFIGVPPGHLNEERPPLDARFYFRERPDDQIEVHHPFHGTQILGNGTAIENPTIDRAAVVLFKYMPYLIDSKKLNRPPDYETRMFAGEYAELSHCYSLGLFSSIMGGSPLDGLDGLYNDASKIYDGHQGDDNYQGHGHEDLADQIRASFFKRAGVIDALEEAGVLRRGRAGLQVGNTRLTIDTLLDEDEVTYRRSFLSNKHPARRLDADRFQYGLEEKVLVGCAVNYDRPSPSNVPLALADAALESVACMFVLDDNEGQQLVFGEAEVGYGFSMDYVEHNSEHWCEPVQDFCNDVLNLAERHFFTCEHPFAREFQGFYPQDYLHTSSSLMFERFEEVAKTDVVMAWFLSTARNVSADQRAKSVKYQRLITPYQGPNPPDGMTIQKIGNDEPLVAPRARIEGSRFIIDLPKGKMRTINPRIRNGGGETRPLNQIYPDFDDFCNDRHQWIGNYRATVEIGDPQTARQVADALAKIDRRWPAALASRPPMTPKVLQAVIKEANQYVLANGKFNPKAA